VPDQLLDESQWAPDFRVTASWQHGGGVDAEQGKPRPLDEDASARERGKWGAAEQKRERIRIGGVYLYGRAKT
jgi:hypothetical protein